MVQQQANQPDEAPEQRADEGFTLVELLIVVVVLGILASIVAFGVAQFRDTATTAACKANLKQVDAALDSYSAVKGDYNVGGVGLVRVADLVSMKYLKAAPSADFAITITGDTTAFKTAAASSSVAGCTL